MLDVKDVEKLISDALIIGQSFVSNEKFPEAEVVLNQILKVDPDNLRASQLLGLSKYGRGDYKTAIEIFNKLIEIDPKNPEHYNNISLALTSNAQLDLARSCMQKAIDLNPQNTYYYSNLGLQYRQQGNLAKAMEYFEKAIKIDEKNYYAWVNLGSAYARLKQIDETIRCMEFASSIKPEDKAVRVNLGYAYFFKGDMKKGWEEYENRHDAFKQLENFKKQYQQDKRWKGIEDIADKKLLVYCEQGVGDAIQFCRFLPDIKAKFHCSILLHGPKEIHNLILKNPHLGCDTVSLLFQHDQYDYFCSVMSLPYLLGVETIAPTKPYLAANMANFDQYKKYLKVGIVWAGNPQHPSDAERSCKLSYFKLLQSPRVKLFSIQKETSKRKYSYEDEIIDLTEQCGDMSLINMSPYLEDLEKTARIIQALDLVITVDTAVLHLAGALGKKTWGLIPYNPDWRWGLEGDSTAWYPSVKLFRQPKPGDWTSVFKNIQIELKEISETFLQNI